MAGLATDTIRNGPETSFGSLYYIQNNIQIWQSTGW